MSKLIQMYIAFVIMIGVNALANIIPINGYTTGEVSNMYTVYFTPAGFIFSIWTVIYIALFLWLLSFSLKRQELSQAQYAGFMISSLFNASWIVVWHYLLDGIALIVILALFVTLLYLYSAQRKQQESFLYLLPISLYVGWITVASMTNTLYFLTASVEIDAGMQMVLTYLALAILLIIGFGIIFFLRDWVIIAVFAWSLFGIFYKNFPDQWLLAIVSIALDVFLVLLTVLYFVRTRKAKDA